MLEQIIEKFKEYDTIILCGHIRPDGDCYGSEIGLREIINANFENKEVYCLGTGLKNFHPVFGGSDKISDDKFKNALCVMLDTNDLNRIEDQRLRTIGKELIQIDHHVISEDFDFVNYVDENACSTSEILARMVVKNNMKITSKGANALYLGLLSDSGRFQFVTDYPQVFDTAKELCKRGANPHIINNIIAKSTENKLLTQAYVLTHYKKTKKGVIYIYLTYGETLKTGITSDKGSSIVNLIGYIEDYPIWATFIENEKGACVCEFRSDLYSVVDVSLKYGGGGHRYASGVTIPNFNQNKLQDLITDLENLIGEEM